MFVLSCKRMHKLDGYMEETHLFVDEGELKMYLWNKLYSNNPIIVTGIWEIE